ncbi:sugar phosphate isomerase/epimerase family protein [Streptomyces lonarensis]|uniref:TIM barrel protein n=1 Tax=Streptomyces lonarensis TaxID=700599 RepID=A0A7X6D000_9ACTN|nr:sugar phosphate isomerase/epimerase family protein [Streptomyces lonarensis]NJQ05679.1 TIM barrel protein [Streptomyces lonarensis]
MLKLSYNSNGLRSVPVEDAVRAVADAGYRAIEFSLHPAHIDPFTFRPADADRLAGVLDRHGITACCLAAGADTLLGGERFEPSLIHPSPEGRERRLELIGRAVEIASWLGVPVVNFASGPRRDDTDDAAAGDRLREGLARLLERAGPVRLAIEPEPGFFVESNDQALALVDAAGHPGLTVAQDLGHCRVVEEDYLGSVARALRATSVIQLEDIKGRRHHHEIPGDGDIDFAAFFRICREQGYEGYYSVELYNHSDDFDGALKRSIAHLREQYDAAAG